MSEPEPLMIYPLQSKIILSAPIIKPFPEQTRSDVRVVSDVIVEPQTWASALGIIKIRKINTKIKASINLFCIGFLLVVNI